MTQVALTGESPYRVLPGVTNSDYKEFVRNQFLTEHRKLNLAPGHLQIMKREWVHSGWT